MRLVLREAFYDDGFNVWILKKGEYFKLGITDLAQRFCGKVQVVNFEVGPGEKIQLGSIIANLESDKTTIEIASPVSGKVVALNTKLLTEPRRLNEDCYGLGELIHLIDVDSSHISKMYTAAEYEAAVNSFFKKSK